MPKLSRRIVASLFLLTNTITWGAALPISKFAVEETNATHFLMYRYFFAILFSLPILLFYLRTFQKWKKHLLPIILLECLGTSIALGLLYEGLSRTTSLEASFITTTLPIFTTLAGILYLKERQEFSEWIGMGIALFGALLLTFEPFFSGRQQAEITFSFFGNMLVIGQNIATALYFVLAKKYYKKLPKFLITSLSFYVGFITFALLNMLQVGGNFAELLHVGWQDLHQIQILLPVLYMALFGSIIGLTAYIRGQENIEASEASLFTYLQPLIYIPLAMLLHRENFTFAMLLALVLIVVGVTTAEVRWRKLF